LAIITLFAGFGILKGKKWAWWIAVFIFAANGLVTLLEFLLAVTKIY
jgi:hypothetical protein